MVKSPEHRFKENLRKAQQRAKKTIVKEKMTPEAPRGEEKNHFRNFVSKAGSEASFVPQTLGVIDREYFELAFRRYCSTAFSAALKAAQQREQTQKTYSNYGDPLTTENE